MSNFRIEEKDTFRFVGFKTKLEGSERVHSELFSRQKTEFFKDILQSGKMGLLKPIAESNLGYAVITSDRKNTFYYAGVKSSQPVIDGTNEVIFTGGTYLVLQGAGGLSRLAFDKLEEQAFEDILTEMFEYQYSGNPIAEILLNGNPTDAEVEVWIPINLK